MVLRKLDLLKEAVDVFVEAIHALPLHWGAWLELSNLVTNIEMVATLENFLHGPGSTVTIYTQKSIFKTQPHDFQIVLYVSEQNILFDLD